MSNQTPNTDLEERVRRLEHLVEELRSASPPISRPSSDWTRPPTPVGEKSPWGDSEPFDWAEFGERWMGSARLTCAR